MIELLAVPAWDAPPRSLADWQAALTDQGCTPTIERDGPDECWLVLGSLRLRGYLVLEGEHVAAINFELADPEPAATTKVLEAAAVTLGWEIHPDDEEADDLEGD